MKEKEPEKEMKKSKVEGWSIARMEEKTSKSEFKHTEETRALEVHQSGRSGQTCGRGCAGNEEGNFGEQKKKAQAKEGVRHWNGESSRESRNLNFGSGVKTVGPQGSEITACNEA